MRGAVPARGFCRPLPGGFRSPVDRHKDRSARSVLNRGKLFSFGWRNGRNARQRPPRETRFWSWAIGVVAGGECRKRERRKAGALLEGNAQPRLSRQLVGQCAFRRSASLPRRQGMLCRVGWAHRSPRSL